MKGMRKGLIAGPDGTPIVSVLAQEMFAAGVEEVVLVTNEPEAYAAVGLEMIRDIRPGHGPLSGVEAALTRFSGKCGGTVFLACDAPNVRRDHMARLIEVFGRGMGKVAVAESADYSLEPLCSVVYNDVLSSVAEALDAGKRRIGELWTELGAVLVHFDDERAFVNLNTEEDLRAWRQSQAPGGSRGGA